MRKEIEKAVETFHRIAFGTGKNGRKLISDKQLASFVTVLTELLIARYKNNWYPQKPIRGSGYRCLRMNSQCMDPTIQESLSKSGIKITEALRAMELTIWVDPGVVSLRIGEEGSIGTEKVEMEYRKNSVSEDEAYCSRSPSPMTFSPISFMTPAYFNPSMTEQATQAPSVLGNLFQHNISPPSMPTSGQPKTRPVGNPVSNSQDYMASGHIPTPAQSSYCRPKTLFPPQDHPFNGNHFQGNYNDGMMVSHPYHAAMAMRMSRNMLYMDIPAQA